MIHIIANPAARSGSGKKRIHTLVRLLKQSRKPYRLHMTAYSGHAGEIAHDLKVTPEDQVILVGGDGSINEVINGILLPYPASGLLMPAGSGNDFARGLQISHDPVKAVERLADSKPPVRLDLGEITHSDGSKHRFAVSCGIGMDAAVCSMLEKGKLKSICNRFSLGKIAYIIDGILTLLSTDKKKRAGVTLTLDSEKTIHFENMAFLAIHNLPFEGGGFRFAPDASAEDGQLDLCLVTVSHRIFMIPLLIACLAGGRHTLFGNWVHMYRCRTVSVSLDRELTLHTDGEVTENIREFSAAALKGVIPFLL